MRSWFATDSEGRSRPILRGLWICALLAGPLAGLFGGDVDANWTDHIGRCLRRWGLVGNDMKSPECMEEGAQ